MREMFENEEVVWKPILGQDGVLHGIALSSIFAKKCFEVKLTEERLKELSEHLWNSAKPQSWDKDYMPGEVLTWYEDSLLISTVCMRHAGSGKWLNAMRFKLKNLNDSIAVTYSYHHSGWHDMDANLWLQYAFDWWVKIAQAELKNIA